MALPCLPCSIPKIALNLINSTSYNYSNRIKFSHFSGIYKGGKLIYQGSNHDRNTYNGKCHCHSTHAEIDVIYRLLKGEACTTTY